MQQKTSEFIKNFSASLKLARIRRGMTQAAVAEELGEGESTISNWENGINGPHRSKLEGIGSLFGVSVDPFTGRFEVPKVGELREEPTVNLSALEFRNLADRLSIECRLRGHRMAARVLMDLVDKLDGFSNDKGENIDERAI